MRRQGRSGPWPRASGPVREDSGKTKIIVQRQRAHRRKPSLLLDVDYSHGFVNIVRPIVERPNAGDIARDLGIPQYQCLQMSVSTGVGPFDREDTPVVTSIVLVSQYQDRRMGSLQL